MNETITPPDLLDDPALIAADRKAVQHFLETGQPADPEVVARVRARSDRSREESFRRLGYVNIGEFMRPSVEEE